MDVFTPSQARAASVPTQWLFALDESVSHTIRIRDFLKKKCIRNCYNDGGVQMSVAVVALCK